MKRSNTITSLAEPELHKRLSELKHELIKLNAQVATGTVPKNPGQIRKTKKTVARILTTLRQRALQELAQGKQKEVQRAQ
ncbi:MAG TPA: 50S ribosomal protein L29 [Candidatus Nanoarchaeia archaeon]|nr:50S ribosomal protein L29 [Candidatus Nanoarchaeia archaeon]